MDPEIARRLLAEHDTKRGAPALRSPDEIQRAHDLLAGIVLGEAPIKDPKAIALCNELGSVLCWALRHDHNQAFNNLLEELEGELHEMGAILRKGKPQ